MVRRILSLLLATALALAGLAALAGPAAATGVVTGTVTDAGGHLLAGTVSAYPTDGSGAPGSSFTGGVVDVTFPDGEYRLQVRSSTLDGESRWWVAGSTTGTTVQAEATVVTFPGPAVEITMVFPEIAQVTGRVVGTDGQGIPGAYVLRNRQGSYTQVTADADGYYDLGHQRAGTIALTGGKQGSHAQTTVQYDVPASGVHTVPDIVVSRYSTVTGVVTAPDGSPLEGVVVHASNTGFAGSGESDETGRYTIEQLPADTFTLTFEDLCGDYAPGTGSVTVAEEGTGTADEVLDPAPVTPLAHVSAEGTVTMSDGSSPRCVTVTTDTQEANVGIDGTWQLDSGVDETVVRAYARGAQRWMPAYWPDAWTETDATRVALSPETTVSDLDMTVHRAARITGTTDASNGIATFEVWTADGVRAARGLTGSGSVGSFELWVREGSWKVLLVGDDEYAAFLPRWLGDAASLDTAPTWTVAAGETVATGRLALASSLVGVSAPVVSGTPSVGSTLVVSSGSWNLMTGTTFAQEWRRGGIVVGTGPTYVVQPADVGQVLVAAVTATNTPPGRAFSATQVSAPVTATAAPVLVPAPATPAATTPAATTTRLRASSPARGVVRLVVTVASSARADGTVTIRRGSKVVKRRVALDRTGRAVVRLRRQRPGRATYTATYSGSPTTASSSARARLRVRG